MSGDSLKPPVAQGRMLSVQASLPKLPVPSLRKTLDRYLKSVRPLVTEEEYVNTEAVSCIVLLSVEFFALHPHALVIHLDRGASLA
jgi:hypothetical protein